jgi:ligand-binding SRPBCC domain-containing protein
MPSGHGPAFPGTAVELTFNDRTLTMRLHRLEATQFLPIPLEQAWGFFSDPANLSQITPPGLNLKPTSKLPPAMHPGLIVTYDVAPFPGVRVFWVTEITQVVHGVLFVDEQRAGPYRFWHHQHHFRTVADGTEMRDIVHYALPFGLAGDLLGRRTVRHKVGGIFEYRREALQRIFGPAPVRSPAPVAPGLSAAQT